MYISLKYIEMSLELTGNKMKMEWHTLMLDKENATIIGYWECDRFKDMSYDLRMAIINKYLEKWGSELIKEAHIIYEAYTTDELKRFGYG